MGFLEKECDCRPTEFARAFGRSQVDLALMNRGSREIVLRLSLEETIALLDGES